MRFTERRNDVFLKDSRRFKSCCLPFLENRNYLEYYRVIQFLREHPYADGWTGGIIVDADSELFTKSAARNLPLRLTSPAVLFVGRPLVEGTKFPGEFCHRSPEYGYDLRLLTKKSAAWSGRFWI